MEVNISVDGIMTTFEKPTMPNRTTIHNIYILLSNAQETLTDYVKWSYVGLLSCSSRNTRTEKNVNIAPKKDLKNLRNPI